MCKFRNLNGQFVTPLPSKYISLMECCGTNTCGGVSIHVGSGTTFGTVAPGWFVERVIEADTVYLIKKRQIMVFEAPVSLTLLVSAFLSLFFSLSLSLCDIVQVKVEKKPAENKFSHTKFESKRELTAFKVVICGKYSNLNKTIKNS